MVRPGVRFRDVGEVISKAVGAAGCAPPPPAHGTARGRCYLPPALLEQAAAHSMILPGIICGCHLLSTASLSLLTRSTACCTGQLPASRLHPPPTQHVCRQDILRPWHWRPLPLCAKRAALCEQQGRGCHEGRHGFHHRAHGQPGQLA